jgi:hypothetical protein
MTLIRNLWITALACALPVYATPLSSWLPPSGEQNFKLNDQTVNGAASLVFSLTSAESRTLRLPVADFFGEAVRVVGSVRILQPGQRVNLLLDTITGTYQIADLHTEADWQDIHWLVPPGMSTGATQLRLIVTGEGLYEFEGLRTLTAAEDQPHDAAQRSDRAGWYSRFFHGDNPWAVGWSTWTGSGTLTQAFDFEQYRDGSRSIMLKSVDGPMYGATAASWENPAKRFKIKGAARAVGTMNECVVAIQYFGPEWKKLEWHSLIIVTPNGEWQEFDAVADSPEGTVRASLTLIFNGEGALWLDEPLVTVE